MNVLTFEQWKRKQDHLNIGECVFCDYENENEDCDICDGKLFVVLTSEGKYIQSLFSLYKKQLEIDKGNWNKYFLNTKQGLSHV